MDVAKKAFVLRIAPGGQDKMQEALDSDDIFVGWSDARGLLEPELGWLKFRQIVHDVYHKKDDSFYGSGQAAGSLWRFIREMHDDDMIVVPYGNEFYVGRVAGPCRYEESKVEEDTAYRRRIHWLNDKKSIPRCHARAALQSRMKAWQTCVDASDLVADIQELLGIAGKGEPSFDADLRRRLVSEALEEIRSGRLNDRGFEELIATVIKSLGGTDVRIVPRNLDKGADVLATFLIATSFKFTLAVQAKHYQPEPPVGVSVLDQLVQGMEAEGADLGWVVTSGKFSEKATQYKAQLEDQQGYRIELIDGEQLAALIVEGGLKAVSASGYRATDNAE